MPRLTTPFPSCPTSTAPQAVLAHLNDCTTPHFITPSHSTSSPHLTKQHLHSSLSLLPGPQPSCFTSTMPYVYNCPTMLIFYLPHPHINISRPLFLITFHIHYQRPQILHISSPSCSFPPCPTSLIPHARLPLHPISISECFIKFCFSWCWFKVVIKFTSFHWYNPSHITTVLLKN